MLDKAIEKIENQQPKVRNAVWMVGEQLKDMLRAEPYNAELIFNDLDVAEMSLSYCEKKIKTFADKNKSNGFSCVIPLEAEKIIREFYGLHNKTDVTPKEENANSIINILDFL